MVHSSTVIHHSAWGLGEIITAFLTRRIGQNAYMNNRFTRRRQLRTPTTPHCLKYIQYIQFNTKQPASTAVEWVTAQVLYLYLNFSALGKFFPPIPLIIFNRVITKPPFVRGYCTNVRLIFLAMVYSITEILSVLSFFTCWNSCRSGAAKINHIVLRDEKQLPAQMYVQRTEEKFSINYPAGTPERTMSLITLITRVLHWSSTYINVVTVMLRLQTMKAYNSVEAHIQSF
jgi:hypothetical protein